MFTYTHIWTVAFNGQTQIKIRKMTLENLRWKKEALTNIESSAFIRFVLALKRKFRVR